MIFFSAFVSASTASPNQCRFLLAMAFIPNLPNPRQALRFARQSKSTHGDHHAALGLALRGDRQRKDQGRLLRLRIGYPPFLIMCAVHQRTTPLKSDSKTQTMSLSWSSSRTSPFPYWNGGDSGTSTSSPDVQRFPAGVPVATPGGVTAIFPWSLSIPASLCTGLLTLSA